MNRQSVVYQGTFDPFTNGHLSVVQSARRLFERVVVLLLVNPDKTPLFSVQERKEMIEQALRQANIDGVSVDFSEGLLADYMRRHGLQINVRGVRNGTDCEYELQNHRLSLPFYPSLQTVLLPCQPALADVSSSAVKAACRSGRLPRAWVPQAVCDKLQKRFPSLILF